ncbi:MAG: helix-turn-helix transcriptional regulator [Anaerolineae bacterium]|jgi:DNA-binding PadR family transcriptional regulator|nr:helix-turn-helix transcriptional regulator [Anaerolineae bacterium]
MTGNEEHFDQLRLELRRGVVVLAVLSLLENASYGYHLIQRLSALGLEIEEGTLYPLLRRLEKQGLLYSEWDTSESRPRKYYRISAVGKEIQAAMQVEWQETVKVMRRILEGDQHE